jgi:glutamate-5-semialdehyde dehydrogenase
MSTAEQAIKPALKEQMFALGRAAKSAADVLTRSTGSTRNAALLAAAAEIRSGAAVILEANAEDMAAAKERGLSGAMLDRLALDPARIEAMAAGVESIADLDDPIGQVMAEWDRPNGLKIQRVRVPLGVIGII